MMGIFLIVAVFLVLPGAKRRAVAAAQIPLNDDHPMEGDRR
jgi:cbb3-type cytochrome oxidase subunit 3